MQCLILYGRPCHFCNGLIKLPCNLYLVSSENAAVHFVEHAMTPACVCEYSPLMSIYADAHLYLVCCLLCRKDGGVHVAHSGAPALPTSRTFSDTGPGPGAYAGTRSAGVPSGETTLPVHQNHHVSCCWYVCSHSDNDSVEREKENAKWGAKSGSIQRVLKGASAWKYVSTAD